MNADTEGTARVPEVQSLELAVEVFGMLADATRIRLILAMKERGELSVNNLAAIVDKSPASVSQHLAKLRLGRMVSARREGTRVFYRLTDEHAGRLVTEAILQAEHALDTPPHHHRAAEAAK
jgi:DNA-binding transcriptional ArsR family regulator